MSAEGAGDAARFVLTGAPGAGKTSVLRALSGLGYDVVAEAAKPSICASGSSSWTSLLPRWPGGRP